ncbi:MAG TPA: carbohydrate ABC transporter permease [Streptosporangiaceae bacterium]
MSAAAAARKRISRARWPALRYVLLLLGLVVTTAPFAWSVYIALTDRIRGAGTLLDFPNFTEAWRDGGFSTYTLTTAGYSLVTGLGATAVSALGGYAFGRLRFRGRGVLFAFLLSMAMIPGTVIVLPLFIVMIRFPLAGGNSIAGLGGSGFYNTFSGLVLPGFAVTTTIFLARQFFAGLPRDLEMAARIDGASEWRIFWRIMLPLARPGMITVFVLQFQDSWNAYLWPTVIANSQNLWTLQVGLQSFQRLQAGTFGAIGSLQAGALLASVPIIVVFAIAQKAFRRGISISGVQ